MSEFKPWDSNRGVIRSYNGGWIRGKGVFVHGFNLLEDLVGHVSFSQVLFLNTTGRLPEKRLGQWFEALQICLSYPDPRIWCNQIGALGGTVRTSVVAATTAGILASESKIYGPKTVIKGMEFIQSALQKRKQGISIETIVNAECYLNKPKIMGYARPVVKGDERIPVMEKVTKDLGFEVGEHLQLAYEIEDYLVEKFDERINIGGYMAAFFSDQNFSPQEVYRLLSVVVSSGVTACCIDALMRPVEAFLPMRCEDIDYQGPPPRPVPEKE